MLSIILPNIHTKLRTVFFSVCEEYKISSPIYIRKKKCMKREWSDRHSSAMQATEFFSGITLGTHEGFFPFLKLCSQYTG